MKITKTQLKRMIKEELGRVMREAPDAEAGSQDPDAPTYWQLSLPLEIPGHAKEAIQSEMNKILKGMARQLKGLGAKYAGGAAHDGSGRTLSEPGGLPTFLFYTTPQTDRQQYEAAHDKIEPMLKKAVSKLVGGNYERMGIDRDTAREFLGQMDDMSWTPVREGGD